MTQHTPGPWTVRYRQPGSAYSTPMPEIRAGETSIADIRWNGHNTEHGLANARLIAKAPEQQNELTSFLRCFDRDDGPKRRETRASGAGVWVFITRRQAERVRALLREIEG